MKPQCLVLVVMLPADRAVCWSKQWVPALVSMVPPILIDAAVMKTQQRLHRQTEIRWGNMSREGAFVFFV